MIRVCLWVTTSTTSMCMCLCLWHTIFETFCVFGGWYRMLLNQNFTFHSNSKLWEQELMLLYNGKIYYSQNIFLVKLCTFFCTEWVFLQKGPDNSNLRIWFYIFLHCPPAIIHSFASSNLYLSALCAVFAQCTNFHFQMKKRTWYDLHCVGHNTN